MPSTTEIIKRLGDLEAFVKTLAVQTEIDTRIDTINDTLGVLQGDIEKLKQKLMFMSFHPTINIF
jgi:chaperonin cofactor prefoldin